MATQDPICLEAAWVGQSRGSLAVTTLDPRCDHVAELTGRTQRLEPRGQGFTAVARTDSPNLREQVPLAARTPRGWALLLEYRLFFLVLSIVVYVIRVTIQYTIAAVLESRTQSWIPCGLCSALHREPEIQSGEKIESRVIRTSHSRAPSLV